MIISILQFQCGSSKFDYITFFTDSDGDIKVSYGSSTNSVKDFKNRLESITMEIFMKDTNF